MEDVQLSKNFSLYELTNSTVATRKGIKNIPGAKETENLRKLATGILQPIREAYGRAIHVNSGYRSPALNRSVGGSATSQHKTGEAADISVGSKAANKVLFGVIKNLMVAGKIKVGQLINEHGYSWIHVSLPRVGKPNGQILAL